MFTSRVIQNPFGKVIFVKKAPRNQFMQRETNLNGQITVLSIFRLFYYFQRTKFSSTDIFFQNVFWQNSRQQHNLKLTPQGVLYNSPYWRSSCIWRNSDLVIFGAPHSNLNPGFRSFDRWDLFWAGFGPREGLGQPKVTSSGSIFSNQNGIWAILMVLGSGVVNRMPALSRYTGAQYPVPAPEPTLFSQIWV